MPPFRGKGAPIGARVTRCGRSARTYHLQIATLMRCGLLAIGWACATGAVAQEAAPPGTDAATFAAKRFPQPVRVGDLLHRTVLEPVESRRILGHVDRVIRFDGGKEAIVMTFGGQQLGAFPTYSGMGSVLGTEEIIHMGLAHPSH